MSASKIAEGKIAENEKDLLDTSRRRLFRNVGLGATGLAAGAAGLSLLPAPAHAADIDSAILNFALNLEYLEANFYSFATTGEGLPRKLTIGATVDNEVIGGAMVPFQSTMIQQYAHNIYADERAHVQFIRDTLGDGNYVGQPKIDLQDSFTTLAVAAGLIQQGQTFNPFADETSFLLGAYIFEDVGVTAYLGALTSIKNGEYVTAAGGIMAVEAYHAATIRELLATAGAGVATDEISKLRAKLAGANDDEGILRPNGMVNIAPTGINALAFPRTTRQVLNIVYGAQNATSGLFYPNGMASL
jgi:hypothetical protein